MIKNKNYFYLSIILFFLAMLINFPYPHDFPHAETRLTILNVMVKGADGIHYDGVFTLLLLLSSLLLLGISLEKYHGRIVLIALIAFVQLPQIGLSLYQRTIATDINAVHFDKNSSECNFQMLSGMELKGTAYYILEILAVRLLTLLSSFMIVQYLERIFENCLS